jgi:large subunit ribosomal protein L14
MISVQTRLVISDNTGGSLAQCIKILGHSNRKVAKVGDIIIVSIKAALAGKIDRSKTKGTGKVESGQSGKASDSKAGSKQTKVINVRKGEVHKALVIRTKVPSGSACAPHGVHGMCFEDNAVVLLNNKYEPLGTRIFGPINSYELRRRPIAGTLKILSLAQLSL